MRARPPRPALTLAVVSVAVLSGACDPGGWKLVDSGTDKALRAVFVETPERIYIAGDDGTVLFFDGTSVTDTSTVVPGGASPTFYGVAASSRELTVVGDDGAAFTRRDGAWSVDDTRAAGAPGSSRRMLTLLRPTPSSFLAAGEGGKAIRRSVGEARWSAVDVKAPSGAKITGGWAISQRTIALATNKGVILELVDAGWVAETVATETSTAPVPLFGVWSSTRGADLVAVGLGGSIFRRAEGTVGWSAERTRVTQDLYGIFGVRRDLVWAVGASGSILEYDGSAWSAVPSPTARDLFAVAGTPDGGRVVAVGARGAILVRDQK